MLNKEELLSLISKALKVSKKTINMSLKVGDIEEWDSLGVLSVMTALDKKYKGLIKISSFDKVITVSDILKLLK